ncbi:hypothetical protein [Neobacillus cucumis]|uniref:hypothetical protein n=1 Tax=Neobacillus cucumis TaxID=1740721 RepID=UPI002852F514|nr:hypothetical protein [Neobacillus cucumis]MDR4947109.1 hypothetical protein [Neobacillus cucumis]
MEPFLQLTFSFGKVQAARERYGDGNIRNVLGKQIIKGFFTRFVFKTPRCPSYCDYLRWDRSCPLSETLTSPLFQKQLQKWDYSFFSVFMFIGIPYSTDFHKWKGGVDLE